ncbi:Transcriptional regulatory protein ZraR [Pirellulimonas nuda]|uniref:Transcriptional regulatory protein ZraR n=1 Tax=Pirellulimonas nuda TaxID=2528009 RepID=A0A518DBU2_9BACT|nr:sigma-54 dependent transcriptional regulator [Pirellulimonas nuda]QDU88954.1 Transcriptional regulatory protein ZraR [Pirellulimonas nuda]
MPTVNRSTIGRNLDMLIVDDDEELREGLASYFTRRGHAVAQAADAQEALRQLESRAFGVAILDVVMPGMSGMDLLGRMRDEHVDTEVVLLTGEGSIETAVEAMKLGACDFLTKPIRLKQLEGVVHKAVETGRIRKENRQLSDLLRRSVSQHHMIGDSPAIREVFRLIERAGPSDKPILIQGESGAGKELIARALHEASPRADKPMVVINCAAMPELLLESELFGHEKGAFTGASASKPGLFEAADGGSLFIDEIGELSAALQPKLLRVLEDGSLRRVGSLKERRVDVRLIAATNRDITFEVQEKRFREDLYYRINMMTIQAPPLRERGADVRILAEHFCGEGWEFEPECLQAIEKYHWPGNVRQLINAIERMRILADNELLCKANLPPEVLGVGPHRGHLVYDSDIDLATLTRARIVQAMRENLGNKARAAEVLGVNRRSLYRLIGKYQILPSELGS